MEPCSPPPFRRASHIYTPPSIDAKPSFSTCASIFGRRLFISADMQENFVRASGPHTQQLHEKAFALRAPHAHDASATLAGTPASRLIYVPTCRAEIICAMRHDDDDDTTIITARLHFAYAAYHKYAASARHWPAAAGRATSVSHAIDGLCRFAIS